MLSSAFNIGVSGLQTTQRVIDMLSHNIANADTPGYKRQENHNREVNFSGPDNKPYLPAGVTTSISSNDQPWIDKRMNDALRDKAESDAVKDGVDGLERITSDSTLEKTFTDFMNASHAHMQFPDDPVRAQVFQDTGQAFTNALNRVDGQFAQVKQDIVIKMDLNQVRMQALQSRLQDLAGQPNTEGNVDEINYLKQQISQVTGNINGYNRVLSEIIPPVTGVYEKAKQDVIDGANASYGKILISKQQDYAWENATGGNTQALVEFGNQKFNFDIGRLKTVVGSMQESANISNSFRQQNVDYAQQTYDQAYGVDLADQAVKMQQYQRLYEANAQVIKTADNMMGALLNIFAWWVV